MKFFEKIVENVKQDKSALFLLVSNIATIFLALALNWNLIVILWGYWLQSIIIGFFNFFKILTAKSFFSPIAVNGKIVELTKAQSVENNVSAPFNPLLFFSKIFIACFFAVHYGFFHFVYAIFLAVFSVSIFANGITPADLFYILLMGGIFFANHLFSFFYNRKAEKSADVSSLMFAPYARIIPMHLTIIFGGFIVMGLGNGFAEKIVLIFFLLLKTGADLQMHSQRLT